MSKGNNILIIAVSTLLTFACKGPEIVIHGTQEYISLKLVNETRYRYLYYNLSGTDFIYAFNAGRYVKSNKVYKLFPDSIKQDNYPIIVLKKHNNETKDKIRIQITTDITGEYANKYTVHLSGQSVNLVFHGSKIDTMISDIHLDNFRIKVDLADKFVKGMGNQLPAFTSITSSNVIIDPNENDISIHIPVSFSTFFYKYQNEIDLQAVGARWKVNDREIQMRNVDF